jgi:hypothetical protein
MIARSIAMALLLNLVCQMSTAAARGGAGTADHPWNSEHINQLPAEVRGAVSHLCGPSLRAAHYFATYSENSRFLNLHFEYSHCQARNVCTQAGCLHQVYILTNGRYRLFRSYYGSGND